jgi:Flp pilus assembly pilin Flp
MFLEVFLYVTMTSARRSSGLSPSSRPRTVESAPTSSSARVRVRDDRGREVNHLTSFFTTLDTLRKREEGQTMAEYGVVLAVITIGVVVALGALALAVSGKLGEVTGILSP